MKLPIPYLNIIPFEQYVKQGPPPPPQTSTSQVPTHRPEDVVIPPPTSSTKDTLEQIARNQFLLEARLKRTDNKIDRLDSKLDKRFNKLKSFFGTIWEAISCASTSAPLAQDPGKRPMPPTFTLSSSEEGTSSGASTQHMLGRGMSHIEEGTHDDDNNSDDEEREEEGDKDEGEDSDSDWPPQSRQ